LPQPALIAICVAGGYLIGSVPFGLIAARLGGVGDIRQIGSGNIGATNVLRSGRKDLALITLIGDAGKGALAILLGWFIGKGTADVTLLQALAGGAAFFGHCFPIWLRFKGGKGVATFLGILIPLLPIAAAIYAAIWLVVLLTIRISSMAGMAAAASAPLSAYLLQSSLFPILLGFAVLVFWKHRENILRLRKGTEPRISLKT